MKILGLTGGFHFGSCDASASIVVDGNLIASVEEERITRVKGSFSMPPALCIKVALEIACLDISDIDYVGIYVSEYDDAVREMHQHITSLFGYCPEILKVNHHLCHAASSFYASEYEEATIVTFDWSGDGVSSSIWKGSGNSLELIESIPRPNSLGIFYAAFTQLLGFERGDEYKVMGLASYGNPNIDLSNILDTSECIYKLNTNIINKSNRSLYQLVYNSELTRLLPNYQRFRYSPIEKKHIDLASSVQASYENAVTNFVEYAIAKTGVANLCIAGGGGLNCTANGKLLKSSSIKNIFVPPFPNDTGCSYGAACVISINNNIKINSISSAQYGPYFSDNQIKNDIDLLKCEALYSQDIAVDVANEICKGSLVGWFQGGLEVGPRALGGRSILADPTNPSVKERINKYVKFREDFRPFAPSVLLSKCSIYFDLNQESPFMNFIANVKLKEIIPGVTHVDGTARIHTVKDNSGLYSKLLKEIENINGHPVVLNTSFNFMGQPIVCTPKEAIYTFFGTGLDVLAIGNWILRKK